MLAEFLARLQAQVAALKLIEGAAAFAATVEAAALPRALPAAYVIPLSETPAPAVDANVIIQRVAVQIAVILVVKNVTDDRGDAAQADLAVLRAASQAALLGWAPAGAEPLERGPGGLLAFRGGAVWWQDVYSTNIYLRA